MEYHFAYRGNTLYIFAAGEIDMTSADAWRHYIDAAVREYSVRNLIFDFTGVTFIDSSGLGVILGRYRTLQPWGGKIHIRGANPQVYKILSMSGFHRIMDIETPGSLAAGGDAI